MKFEDLSRNFEFDHNRFNKAQIDILKNLGDELAFNYITNSFGVDDKPKIVIDRICNLKNTVFFEKFETRNKIKCRNIVIVGAGASKDSYNILPTGQDMMNGFNGKYVLSLSGFLKDKYDQLKSETESLSLYDFDFENFLYVLSHSFITRQELRQEIAQYTDFRYPPSLFYESIAHLLNHGFIDAVINFNFEELLDQAIEDEIDRSNYRNILSDGDCVDLDDLLVDGRLKTP